MQENISCFDFQNLLVHAGIKLQENVPRSCSTLQEILQEFPILQKFSKIVIYDWKLDFHHICRKMSPAERCRNFCRNFQFCRNFRKSLFLTANSIFIINTWKWVLQNAAESFCRNVYLCRNSQNSLFSIETLQDSARVLRNHWYTGGVQKFCFEPLKSEN